MLKDLSRLWRITPDLDKEIKTEVVCQHPKGWLSKNDSTGCNEVEKKVKTEVEEGGQYLKSGQGWTLQLQLVQLKQDKVERN